MDAAYHLNPRGGGDGLIVAAPSVPPYTSPALAANLVFRVLLGVIANLVCLVPLRILYRTGDLAAVVFIITIEAKNLETIVFALIWSDDDIDTWWPGYGMCDVSSFFQAFLTTLFATCLLAMMRNLARQVGLMRANSLSVEEKRRRNLVQAAIMFPLPLIQVGFLWFLTAQRYAVGTLIGCTWVGYGAWPYLVFFVLGPTVVCLITVIYAVLTYIRFRQVAKGRDAALSSNRVANHRAQRARRRLYLIVICVLVPYFPVMVATCVLNIRDMGPLRPFNYDTIHDGASSYPWSSIIFLTSDQIGFAIMNIRWIPILASIPVFISFGMTKEAMNDYRKVLLFGGMGAIFPRLHCEYDPDQPSGSDQSNVSTQIVTPNGSSIAKFRIFTSSNPLSSQSISSEETAIQPAQIQSLNFLASSAMEAGQSTLLQRPEPAVNPHGTPRDPALHRNPFLFRTRCNLTVPAQLRSLLRLPEKIKRPRDTSCDFQLDHVRSEPAPLPAGSPDIHTRVWSDDETQRPLSDSNRSDADRGDAHSVPSQLGVHVETTLTRETHEAADETQR